MNALIQILVCGVTGTLLMTGFSYLVSTVSHQQFREPVLLNKLLYRANITRNPDPNYVYGWAIHFIIGFIFNVIYYLFSETHITSWLLYIVFGTLSGVIACVIWEISFIVHPNPPAINYKGFYLQLFVAHIIFGIASWLPLLVIGEAN